MIHQIHVEEEEEEETKVSGENEIQKGETPTGK